MTAKPETAEPLALNAKTTEQNLYLWRQVQATDPDHTKPVSIGRKLTAIDSYYQIKRATEQFGPVGEGWGWTATEEHFVAGSAVMAKVKLTVWYKLTPAQDVRLVGPVIAMNQIYHVTKDGKAVLDDEAFKKATTDAITKCLSFLGFSADVFMGLFDDAKYVAQRKVEIQAQRERSAPLPETIKGLLEQLKDQKATDDLEKHFKANAATYKALPKPQYELVVLKYSQRKLEIDPSIAPADGGGPPVEEPPAA